MTTVHAWAAPQAGARLQPFSYQFDPITSSGNVAIALRMTSPLCHALPYFQMEVERVLAGISGMGEVKCTFDDGANWQPDNMVANARRKLAERRELVRNRAAKPAGTA
jgi:metal-sulfur cluster biosynthetic enzyme